MMVLLAAALVWCLMPWAFVRPRFGARRVEFAPTEEMSPERLFGCLLSANFAVLMNDNFNQLASALPERHVRRLLAEHWGIQTRADCLRVIGQRMERLGEISPAEMRAVAAWLEEQRLGADGACTPHRSPAERLASADDMSHGHLSVLAWDIQQLAYLVRLACAVGHVSQRDAEAVLERLAIRARMHYGSWEVYSLAALVGLGMRGAMEVFETSAWERYSRTHSVLLRGRRSPIGFASSWSVARAVAPGLPADALRPDSRAVV
ncbi:Protein of unknown function [Variovorax sp. HW608]|uniref:DUF1266 domain-containing protein n=1 Tax=Variovorax sp. HW608 TaxID=1034889 RepID=UPI0008200DC1|nr:DUF1266 domain-containing protein [Variovorax sp. HW608]SCK61060.1 Protein of unknown function [Variovorax sp. HW608]